jgi:hypothetical protein
LSESAHQILKKYLLELGESVKDSRGKAYYEVYSGDSEPLDIRLGKKHLEYQPDVVWKRRGTFLIIELAFNEDWRSIVGELTLAHLAKDCSGVLIITAGWDSDFVDNVVSLVGKKLDLGWCWINLDQTELDDLEKAKKTIKSYLKKWQWI